MKIFFKNRYKNLIFQINWLNPLFILIESSIYSTFDSILIKVGLPCGQFHGAFNLVIFSQRSFI